MTTDQTSDRERIVKAALDEKPWRDSVRAVLRYEGYTDDDIATAGKPLVHSDECTDSGHPFGYDCADDEGRDQHPLHTRANEIAETYRLFWEESPHLADAALAALDLPARDNAVARKALSRLAANRHKVGLSVAAYHPNLAVELLDDSKAVIAYRDRTYPAPKENPDAR